MPRRRSRSAPAPDPAACRRRVPGSVVAGFAALALVTGSACSGGDDAAPASMTPSVATTVAPATTTTVAATTTTVAATTTTVVTELEVPDPVVAASVWVRADQPGEQPLDPAFQAALVDFVRAYVATSTAEPAAGRPSAVEPLLTEAARNRLDDAARAVLADDGLPPLVAATLQPPQLTLTALTGQDLTTVTAVSLQVILDGTTAAGAVVSIARSGELTVVSDGSTFAIDAFRLDVQRDIP
jgi:hypothetical protein